MQAAMSDALDRPPTSFGIRLNKTCDACQGRKIRCVLSSGNKSCQSCLKKDVECCFSTRRPGRRRNVASQFLSPKRQTKPAFDTTGSPEVSIPYHVKTSDSEAGSCTVSNVSTRKECISPILVDRLISNAARLHKDKVDGSPFFTPENGILGGRHSLTFFSDSRLQSLRQCLQHTKVDELVRRVAVILNERLRKLDADSTVGSRQQQPESLGDPSRVALYIELYFKAVHPNYPFLDTDSWKATTSRTDFPNLLKQSKPWTCLYYAVLALGSQYANCGSFESGTGEAWQLFSIALGGFSELLLLPDSLVALQAVTAMAVFGLGVNALSIEHVIMSEAARRAQNMSKIALPERAANVFQRNFWLLYCLEKVNSFHFGRSSGFVDGDICCPIPRVSEAVCLGFDWFLPMIQYARLISKAYTHLYSAGVSSRPTSYYLNVLEHLSEELEHWRLSIPDTGFRPRGLVKPHVLVEPRGRATSLMFHYLYYSLLLSLCRTTLWYIQRGEEGGMNSKGESLRVQITEAARAVLELTPMVDVEPYTQIWVVAGIPIAALFVLFDSVIHNAKAPGTQTNLVLLDMAAGHFSRLEYATGGSLPASLISEFAHIARDHVNDSLRASSSATKDKQAVPKSDASISRVDKNPPAVRTAARVAEPGAPVAEAITQAPAEQALQPGTSLSFEEDLMQAGGDLNLGTDVMDLFNYFVPDLDPMFYEPAEW